MAKKKYLCIYFHEDEIMMISFTDILPACVLYGCCAFYLEV